MTAARCRRVGLHDQDGLPAFDHHEVHLPAVHVTGPTARRLIQVLAQRVQIPEMYDVAGAGDFPYGVAPAIVNAIYAASGRRARIEGRLSHCILLPRVS